MVTLRYQCVCDNYELLPNLKFTVFCRQSRASFDTQMCVHVIIRHNIYMHNVVFTTVAP